MNAALPLLTFWRVTLWGNLGEPAGTSSSIPGPSPTVVIATAQASRTSPSVPGCRIACPGGPATLCIRTKPWASRTCGGRGCPLPPPPGCEADARPGSVSPVQPAREPPWMRRPPAPW